MVSYDEGIMLLHLAFLEKNHYSLKLCIFFLQGQFLFDQKRVTEAAAMFTKAMELAPGDFEIAFTAAGYLRYILG